MPTATPAGSIHEASMLMLTCCSSCAQGPGKFNLRSAICSGSIQIQQACLTTPANPAGSIQDAYMLLLMCCSCGMQGPGRFDLRSATSSGSIQIQQACPTPTATPAGSMDLPSPLAMMQPQAGASTIRASRLNDSAPCCICQCQRGKRQLPWHLHRRAGGRQL